jgi:hypothetical protein
VDPSKVRAILQMSTPNNIKEQRGLIGLTYFNQFKEREIGSLTASRGPTRGNPTKHTGEMMYLKSEICRKSSS